MHARRRTARRSLGLGLLAVLLALVTSACGGGEKESKARPCPRTRKPCNPAYTAPRSSSPPSPSGSVKAGNTYHLRHRTNFTSRGSREPVG